MSYEIGSNEEKSTSQVSANNVLEPTKPYATRRIVDGVLRNVGPGAFKCPHLAERPA